MGSRLPFSKALGARVSVGTLTLQLALGSLIAGLPVAATAVGETCNGLPATIVSADATINGGNGDDVIVALTGNQTINGGNGNDTICGASTTTTINGENGNDWILAGSVNTVLNGGSGNDTLFGGNGNDILNGGSGSDACNGGGGTNIINTCESTASSSSSAVSSAASSPASSAASSMSSTVSSAAASSATPTTGDIVITKYICEEGTTVTRIANGPDVNGNVTTPNDCILGEGFLFGYTYQADKEDNSAPYAGASDATPYTQIGTTAANGMVSLEDVPEAGRYNIVELNDNGSWTYAKPDLLGLYCYGDPDVAQNDNYDVTFIPAGGTTYCVAYNEGDVPVMSSSSSSTMPMCVDHDNMIENPSFESPVVAALQQWDIVADGTSGLGWSVVWDTATTSYNSQTRPEPANLEIQSGVYSWVPADGDQYTELDSDWDGPGGSLSGEPASVSIYQDLPTVAGLTYDISFQFSPRPGTPLADNAVELWWNGVLVDTVSADGSAIGNTVWTSHSYQLTATSVTTRLLLKDVGTENGLGSFVDDVHVACDDSMSNSSNDTSSASSDETSSSGGTDTSSAATSSAATTSAASSVSSSDLVAICFQNPLSPQTMYVGANVASVLLGLNGLYTAGPCDGSSSQGTTSSTGGGSSAETSSAATSSGGGSSTSNDNGLVAVCLNLEVAPQTLYVNAAVAQTLVNLNPGLYTLGVCGSASSSAANAQSSADTGSSAGNGGGSSANGGSEGNTSSESNGGNTTVTEIFGLSTPPINGSNGARRGKQTNILGSLISLFGGQPSANDVPLGGFGGPGEEVFTDEESELICTMRKAMPQNSPSSVFHWVSEHLAERMPHSVEAIMAELRDGSICPLPVARSLQQAKPLALHIDAAGYPVSSNDTWNKCIRGTATLADIRNNPDRDEDGYGYSCSRYHTGSTWRHPDMPLYFTWKGLTKSVTLPAGFALAKDATLSQR